LVWAARHWPSIATTTVTVLHGIAANAAGLSARTLRGFLDVALFRYVVDEQPDLRQVLDALELVTRKEAAQRLRKASDVTQVEGGLLSGLTNESDVEFVSALPVETNQYSDDE
jgi:hypothetical protein